MYGKGEGVIEDLTKAYKWILLAGKNGKDVTEIKNFLQQKMTREQTLRAKYLAKQFGLERKEDYHKNEEAGSDNAKCFGSGFFVSSNGHVVTAAHVVEKANEVEIFNQNFSTSAKVVYKDKSLDVAILKADKTKTPFLPIIPSSKVEVATEVFTLGFPQIQIQGSEPKYTKGSISSLSGFEGNRKLFQISVPVQPGNSGSPLLNFKGEVIGVVVARLNSVGILINKGSIPQNVNYAIKSSFVLPFLHTLPEFSLRNRTFPKKRAELISVVKEAVVGVVSY
jgi:S1-C subfamily serine protease